MSATNADGLPTFETERCLCREWRETDVEDAFAMYGDPEVMKGLSGQPEPNIESQLHFLRKAIQAYRERPRGTGFWALERKTDGRIVGAVIVKPIPNGEGQIEVGWHVARECWGQGYAVEAAREAIRIAFRELGIEEILALVKPWNAQSLRVTEKLGFERGESTTQFYDFELIVHRLSRSRARELGLAD